MEFSDYLPETKQTFLNLQTKSVTDLRRLFQFVICDKQYFGTDDVFEIYVCTKPFITKEKSPDLMIVHYNLQTDCYMIFKPFNNG